MTADGRTDRVEALIDAPIAAQLRGLDRILAATPIVTTILDRAPALRLPGWYLGAGCITGAVWNAAHGFAPAHGVRDYDLVYFDADDRSAEAEQVVEHAARELLDDLDITVDVTNEARAHRWYPERFGRTIAPYTSTEEAISTWPSTASSLGVRRDGAELVVCAPFGLRDLFAMVVRPNKAIVPRELYEKKAARWQAVWPRLTVRGW